MKKIILLLSLMVFLMAFQCDDYEMGIFPNRYKASITDKSKFSIGDTIWIEARISSKVYDSKIGDSIFGKSPYNLHISLGKFIAPTSNYNADDALDNFDLIFPLESVHFPHCKNSGFDAVPSLTAAGDLYKIKLGLKAKHSGDFIVGLLDSGKFENSERNLNLIDNYRNPRSTYYLGFYNCGYPYYIGNTTEDIFCFTVE